MADLSRFYELLSMQIDAEARMAEAWIGDEQWPEVGRAMESALRRFLASYLPSGIKCVTGFAAGPDGLSRQCDIIVYDSGSLAPVYVSDPLSVVDASSALLVVEVKRTLTITQFDTTCEAAGLLRKLDRKIKHALFTYEKDETSLETVLKWFDRHEDTPDYLFVLKALQVKKQEAKGHSPPPYLYREVDEVGNGLADFWAWVLRVANPRAGRLLVEQYVRQLQSQGLLEWNEYPDPTTKGGVP